MLAAGALALCGAGSAFAQKTPALASAGNGQAALAVGYEKGQLRAVLCTTQPCGLAGGLDLKLPASYAGREAQTRFSVVRLDQNRRAIVVTIPGTSPGRAWEAVVALTIATIIYWVVFGWGWVILAKVTPLLGWVWAVGLLAVAGSLWRFVVRYMLYLIKAAHIAVLTELITKGSIGNGTESMFAYGKRVVTERFGQVNAMFALDLLIAGIVGAFNRTLNWVSEQRARIFSQVLGWLVVLVTLALFAAIGWYIVERLKLRRRAARIGLDSLPSAERNRLARRLARVTGESLTAAVHEAVRQRLEREERRRGRASVEELMAIARQNAARPIRDPRSADEIIGYDEDGLPT